LSVELLLSDDEQFCSETAAQLDAFNRERQDIERAKSPRRPIGQIEAHFLTLPGIVLFHEAGTPGWSASWQAESLGKYNRPCVVLGNEGDIGQGIRSQRGRSQSGRSAGQPAANHLSSWGGHPMAVGISLAKGQLETFRTRFAEAVRLTPADDISEARLAISVWLMPEQINEGLMDDLDLLHPFGQGNPEPVFGVRGVVLRAASGCIQGACIFASLRRWHGPPSAWCGLENGAPGAAGGRAAGSGGRD
jgi:single-stranded-DNA-specific exonuclease